MKAITKIFDLLVFCVLGYFAVNYYQLYSATQNAVFEYKFDAVYAIAAIFVMVRKPDINTLTLGATLLCIRFITRFLMLDLQGLSGFIVYPVYFLFDLFAIILIWFRPVIFSKYIWPFKGKPGYAITNQDMAMWVLYGFNAVFMLLMTIEQATRKIDEWWLENSRIFYNSYETIQFGFMVLGFFVLYYMTHDGSKNLRKEW